MRAEKIIGSSLEANIEIKLDKEFYEKAKDVNFSEICITSAASVIKDEELKKYLSKKEISKILDLKHAARRTDYIFKKVFK